MIAADRPVHGSQRARLLVIDAMGHVHHAPRRTLEVLCPGDLVVANDAATLPASLRGEHVPTGRAIELRLAGRRSLAWDDVREFVAVVFGEGDFHTRTEDRPAPPSIAQGDRLMLGPLRAVVQGILGHPRLVSIEFEGTPDAIWAGLSRHGRPIQYAHVPTPLALWDVWTAIAGAPVAFEAPSAGFALDWSVLAAMRRGHVEFATLTHAAGISSTGDESLDARLPLDEPYVIPVATVSAIDRARLRSGRVIAVGTTVVRALEHAVLPDGRVRPGPGVADERLGSSTRLRVVDAILTGVHEPGTSHYELLRAFASDATLAHMQAELAAHGYRTHEFGDSVLLEAAKHPVAELTAVS